MGRPATGALILALSLGASPAAASESSGWLGLAAGLHSGPAPLGPGPELSVGGGAVLPWLEGRLLPGLSLGAWQALAVADGESASLDATWHSALRMRVTRVRLDLTARALPADARLNPELSIGPELRLQQVRTTVRSGETLLSERVDAARGWGLRVAAGAGLRLGPGSLGAQLGWTFARMPSALTGAAATGGFDLSPTYRLEL